ncbi:site-specific integrase [Jiangella mangrovi]|uniref:Integrase n=1 Tax=Jiangella mangrovi TaxID=1524084 RepID=A0A7W9GVM0_9ACTN|nr:site-specific integrase [Jiangella mangrovi]MBB5790762.1 integrase [Jiangella mangrovi]
MGRAPLPIGTWGKIRTYVDKVDDKGKPIRHRAVTQFRDFNGRTRQVEAHGKTATAAANALREKLQRRVSTGKAGELTGMHRFSAAADLWMARFKGMVEDGRRSAGSLDTYERQMRHVLPALGEVRLGEVKTPLVDKVIAAIKTDAGAPTAKTCRSIISSVMGLVVRHGVIDINPVREVDRIEAPPKKPPRALTEAEQVTWLSALRADPQAVRKDLPDLTLFMLGTGVRIGESLAVLWEQIDLQSEEVAITHTVIRVRGQGLIRKTTKSAAGVRTLALPPTLVFMLRRRFVPGTQLERPVFPDSIRGLRDPSNVRRDIRHARGEDALAWLTSHAFRKTTATVLDAAGHSARQVADQLGQARVSITQDHYLARRVRNPHAAEVIDQALRHTLDSMSEGGENHG